MTGNFILILNTILMKLIIVDYSDMISLSKLSISWRTHWMPALLNDGKIKHLPASELTPFVAIATYQLAFVYLKWKISLLHIDFFFKEKI